MPKKDQKAKSEMKTRHRQNEEAKSPKPAKKAPEEETKVWTFEIKPKRAPSAYLFFNVEMCKKLRSKDATISQKDAMKTVGEIWNGMDEAKKEKWVKMQKDDEMRFEK